MFPPRMQRESAILLNTCITIPKRVGENIKTISYTRERKLSSFLVSSFRPKPRCLSIGTATGETGRTNKKWRRVWTLTASLYCLTAIKVPRRSVLHMDLNINVSSFLDHFTATLEEEMLYPCCWERKEPLSIFPNANDCFPPPTYYWLVTT